MSPLSYKNRQTGQTTKTEAAIGDKRLRRLPGIRQGWQQEISRQMMLASLACREAKNNLWVWRAGVFIHSQSYESRWVALVKIERQNCDNFILTTSFKYTWLAGEDGPHVLPPHLFICNRAKYWIYFPKLKLVTPAGCDKKQHTSQEHVFVFSHALSYPGIHEPKIIKIQKCNPRGLSERKVFCYVDALINRQEGSIHTSPPEQLHFLICVWKRLYSFWCMKSLNNHQSVRAVCVSVCAHWMLCLAVLLACVTGRRCGVCFPEIWAFILTSTPLLGWITVCLQCADVGQMKIRDGNTLNGIISPNLR